MTEDLPERLPVRCVVTSETPEGKGVFAYVGKVEPIRSPADRIAYPVWGLDGPPSLPVDVAAGFSPSTFPPPEGGYRVRIVQFLPDGPPDAHNEERGQVLGERMRDIDLETGLHATDTIDIGIVLEGELTLVEDDGAEMTFRRWDVFVQNGTRHVWRNRSGSVATVALVFLAADRR